MGIMDFIKGISVTEEGESITITGFTRKTFIKDITAQWGTSKLQNLFELGYRFSKGESFTFNRFFLPDFVYILQQLPKRRVYGRVLELIYENTFMKNTIKEYPSRVDMKVIEKELNPEYTLKDYQLDFIKLYDQRKQQYNLNGYLLALDTGLGKTSISIVLMLGLKKDKIVVICPNNVVYEFAGEINKFCRYPQKIWTKEKPIKDAKWYIINYESMNKLLSIPELKSGNIGIVIDEIHYFRSGSALRVKYAETIKEMTKSTDILTMSGTPIKQAPSELIPLLRLLDPYFNDTTEVIFKKAFGVSTLQLADIIRHRLGMMMYRKMKTEMLTLPEKTEQDILVKIPNGKEFTLKAVKTQIQSFARERTEYYNKMKEPYKKDYEEGLEYFKAYGKFDKKLFSAYLENVDALLHNRYSTWEEKGRLMKIINTYEKEVIQPVLPPELRKRFRKAKSVYKYVNMVILGEVIGNLLTRLRSKMYAEMFMYGPIENIIKKSIKKTIIFTTFTDVVEIAAKTAEEKWGLNPSVIYGKTGSDASKILNDFRTDPKKNPLITTLQKMATGVTVTQANTVIFVGQGFRSVDRTQAISRVYRMGQTDEVFVFTLILDTDGEPNLSTRLQDIVAFSQQMFDALIGENTETDIAEIVGTESIDDDFIMSMLDFSKVEPGIEKYSQIHELLRKK